MMRSFYYLLVFCVMLSFISTAQKYPKCTYHYFKSGKISTSECFDENNRWGKATAYDISGKVIYEKELRHIAGNSSVSFSYYDNGAVKNAHWHSAPDGGIQWYNTYTDFALDGTVTGETQNDYDHKPTVLMQQRPVVVEKRKIVKDTAFVTCAVIYASEYWFINKTPYTVMVDAYRNTNEHTTTTLKRGEAVKGGQQIQAQYFDAPDKYYKFSARTLNGKNRQRLIVIPADKEPEQVSKESRRYYFEIRRII